MAPRSSAVCGLILLAAVCGTGGLARAGNRPKLLWKFATNDWVLGLAVGRDGAIYAGTWTGAVIYVLAPDGVLRRQIAIGNNLTNYGVTGLAVGDDGTIYVESTNERLYALAPDGVLKWKIRDVRRVVAIGRDGAVYTNSFALDPARGEPRTKFSGLVLAVGEDDTIYVQDNGICAFSPSGVLKWKSSETISATAAAGYDGKIYFSSLYQQKVRDPKTGISKYVLSSPGTPRYRVDAFDSRTGSTKWSFQVKGKVFAVVNGHDGTIYAGSYDGNVYALNPDSGALKWRFSAGGDWGKMPVHALALGSNGTIYAGAGRFVEAIQPP